MCFTMRDYSNFAASSRDCLFGSRISLLKRMSSSASPLTSLVSQLSCQFGLSYLRRGRLRFTRLPITLIQLSFELFDMRRERRVGSTRRFHGLFRQQRYRRSFRPFTLNKQPSLRRGYTLTSEPPPISRVRDDFAAENTRQHILRSTQIDLYSPQRPCHYVPSLPLA